MATMLIVVTHTLRPTPLRQPLVAPHPPTLAASAVEQQLPRISIPEVASCVPFKVSVFPTLMLRRCMPSTCSTHAECFLMHYAKALFSLGCITTKQRRSSSPIPTPCCPPRRLVLITTLHKDQHSPLEPLLHLQLLPPRWGRFLRGHSLPL